MLLKRYGVVFRDLLHRESNVPKWRELLGILRRLEERGVVRGGRFVTGFGGEQFALPDAVDSLWSSRHRESKESIIVAGADPMNLVGIALPGDRIPAVPGRSVSYRNGILDGAEGPPTISKPDRLTLNRSIKSRTIHTGADPRKVEPVNTNLLLF